MILTKACASVPCVDRARRTKTDYAARNYCDVWLPSLAPSPPLVSLALAKPFTPQRWAFTGGGIVEKCASRLLSV